MQNSVYGKDPEWRKQDPSWKIDYDGMTTINQFGPHEVYFVEHPDVGSVPTPSTTPGTMFVIIVLYKDGDNGSFKRANELMEQYYQKYPGGSSYHLVANQSLGGEFE